MTRLDRRALLRAMAGAAVGAPLLGGLLARVGQADVGDAPLRFVVLFTGNGDLAQQWVPTGSETAFTLSPVLEPLGSLQQKLLVVHGLLGAGHDHVGGLSEALTGRPARLGEEVATGGPSLDQLLADRWRGQAPLASLELGVWPVNQPSDQVCYSASGLPVPAIGDPAAAFARIVGGTSAPGTVDVGGRDRTRSLLDHLAGRSAQIRDRVGSGGGRLLEEHLRLLRDRERELGEAPSVSCELPLAPEPGGFAQTWRAQLDNIVTALRCGVTRVVTLRAGGAGGVESGGYDELGDIGEHHPAAHGATADPAADLLAIGRFHSSQLAYLLGALDAVDEGECTLLDNTVVVWIRELGLGEFNHHSRTDVHAVIAGGGAAGLSLGRYLNLGGAHYHDFLLSLAHAVGETDVTSFGDHGRNVIERLFA